VTREVGASEPELGKLKADNTDGGGHVVGPNEWRATVDHARRRELMGASPGHHDAPPHVR